MAHAYTTKRGKNKKQKLGNRKDASNNAANKLSQKLFAENPIEFLTEQDSQIRSLGSSATARRKEALDSARQKLVNLLTGSCGNGECPNASKPKQSLLLCNGCKSRAYCDKDCQKSDWSSHKAACKEAQAKRAAEAAEAANGGEKPAAAAAAAPASSSPPAAAASSSAPAANGTSSSPAPAPAAAAEPTPSQPAGPVDANDID